MSFSNYDLLDKVEDLIHRLEMRQPVSCAEMLETLGEVLNTDLEVFERHVDHCEDCTIRDDNRELEDEIDDLQTRLANATRRKIQAEWR
jgi:hypothetical protein